MKIFQCPLSFTVIYYRNTVVYYHIPTIIFAITIVSQHWKVYAGDNKVDTVEVSPEKNPDNAGCCICSAGDKVDTTEEVNDEEDTGPSPIDMSFPTGQGCWKIFLYLISLPLMGPMYITLPDTRNPKCKKFFVVTFLGSIIWIAAFSYLMVWWATVVGQVAGIPPAVSQYIVYF